MPTPFVSPFEENFPGADIAGDEFVFLKAVEQYQREQHRRYPTYREILAIAHALGYRRVAPAAAEFETMYVAAPPPPAADPEDRR